MLARDWLISSKINTLFLRQQERDGKDQFNGRFIRVQTRAKVDLPRMDVQDFTLQKIL
jgi:hypothetical protein